LSVLSESKKPITKEEPIIEDTKQSYFDEFEEIKNELVGSMAKVIKNYEYISKNLPKVGTKDDSKQLREMIQKTTKQANDMCDNSEEMMNKMKKFLTSKDREIKVVSHKIIEDYNKVKDSLKKITKLAKELIEETSLPMKENNSKIYHDDSEDNDQEHLIKKNQNQLVDSNKLQFQDSIIQQRDAEIKAIQKQMVEVNEIFKDIAHLVGEQGEIVDNVFLNIQQSRQHVGEGTKALTDANKSSTAGRSCLCYLAIFITVAVTIAVVIVVIFFSRGS